MRFVPTSSTQPEPQRTERDQKLHKAYHMWADSTRGHGIFVCSFASTLQPILRTQPAYGITSTFAGT